ncbi:Transcriptional regulator PadR-like family protein [Pseudovibrio axinellae]|uniref:Transcriptional regulator PadR-like family protein n=1 Tax=Pseudovibrio axinellae TaxID=989403 RepID=A0A165XL38_9HYPH|nr:PadR family transcriptional regulator [Pseudovibrio axinellae]KZL17808.1 Transcriptional regulator PadR-like family protein [Pseudovibrio axinellae]SEP71644.1 transcriptional regulator, PadR family [Pseudovibrio axinellae]
MSTRKFCLAILSSADATGYEIRKTAQMGHFSHFIEASYGSIYPSLAKMEQEGLVTWREETSSGKPSRKIYSITQVGREAFVKELSETALDDLFRSPFLLLALYCRWVGSEFLSNEIDRRVAHLELKISGMKHQLELSSDPAASWTLEYGISTLSASLEYLKTNRSKLEQIADERVPQTQAAE